MEEVSIQTTDQQAAGAGCAIEIFKLSCLEKYELRLLEFRSTNNALMQGFRVPCHLPKEKKEVIIKCLHKYHLYLNLLDQLKGSTTSSSRQILTLEIKRYSYDTYIQPFWTATSL